jgi:hypothetical protein
MLERGNSRDRRGFGLFGKADNMKFDASFWRDILVQIVGGVILFVILKKVLK